MIFLRERAHSLRTALLITLLVGGILLNASAEDNGLERTPILGWSSWSFLRQHPTAAQIKAQALALRDVGLQKIGYQYVNLDDFWYQCPGPQGPNVDPYGRWLTDSSKFPTEGDTDGIKVVADYIHSLGMKFGIYVTPGISRQAVSLNTPIKDTSYTAAQIADPSVKQDNYNCKGMVRIDYNKPGANEYTNSWVDMLAAWGVDYIKIDGMKNSNAADIEAWSNAIRRSGRPMVLNVTQGNLTIAIAPTLMKYANQWEFAPDVECYRCEKSGSSYPLTSWAEVAKRFKYLAEWQPYAGPGGFNDYDSIEVGNGSDDGLTPVERQTQISMWALGAAPLILGIDLTHLDPTDLQYLENSAVLAIDQDSIAAKRVLNTGNQQVFVKREPNGDTIVGLFNTGGKTEEVSVPASTVALPENGYSLHDLWTGETKKTSRTISAVIPSHGVVLYRVRGL
jgi:hypothetical protein